MGVKYVIIPFDSEGEIFLEDRQYSHQKRVELEEKLDQIPWLEKIENFDKIAVYRTPNFRDHFFVADEKLALDWTMVNPTKYLLQVKDASQPFELYFSEAHDELWQAKIGEKIIPSVEYNGTLYKPQAQPNGLNRFTIERTGDFEIIVEFAAQKYVYWGLVVSAITLLVCIWHLVLSLKS